MGLGERVPCEIDLRFHVHDAVQPSAKQESGVVVVKIYVNF